MLGYTFLILSLSIDPILAPLRPRFPRAIFRSIFAYIYVINMLALLFYNILLMSIRAILYNTNFGSI
jgi:hypothetical protein